MSRLRHTDLCGDLDDRLTVARQRAWLARVPWAPSWPYELLIFPEGHVADLPAVPHPQLRVIPLVATVLRRELQPE
jgi:galactose-1-phosphate uridylyltransferase